MDPGQMSHYVMQGNWAQPNTSRRRSASERSGGTTPPPSKQPSVQPLQAEIYGFDCPICGVFQPGRDGLEKHLPYLEKSEYHRCRQCKRLYDPVRDMICDLRRCVFFCPACKGRFATDRHLKDHIQSVHQGVAFDRCGKCKKRYLKCDEAAHLREEHAKAESRPSPEFSTAQPGTSTQNQPSSSSGATGTAAGSDYAPLQGSQGLQTLQAHCAQYAVPFSAQTGTATQKRSTIICVCKKEIDENDFCAHVISKSYATNDCLDCKKENYAAFCKRVHLQLPVAGWREKTAPCPMCNAVFKDFVELGIHWRRHKNDENFKCSRCGCEFTDYALYRIHHNIHIENGRHKMTKKLTLPFTCPMCHRVTFDDAKHFEGHMGKEHNVSCIPHCPFPDCQKALLEEKLDKHCKDNHRRIIPYQCCWCKQVYQTEKDLNDHRRDDRHEGDVMRCGKCKAIYTRYGHLINHYLSRSH